MTRVDSTLSSSYLTVAVSRRHAVIYSGRPCLSGSLVVLPSSTLTCRQRRSLSLSILHWRLLAFSFLDVRDYTFYFFVCLFSFFFRRLYLSSPFSFPSLWLSLSIARFWCIVFSSRGFIFNDRKRGFVNWTDAMLVTPINYMLCSVNIALFSSSFYHLARKIKAVSVANVWRAAEHVRTNHLRNEIYDKFAFQDYLWWS